MATTVNDFLDAMVTRLQALQVDGSDAFSRVRRGSAVNVAAIRKTATPLPLCVVSDGGGELHQQTIVLDKRRMRVAVVVSHDRDTFGEFAENYLLKVHEALLDEVGYDDTDAIWLAADSDPDSVQVDDVSGGLVLVVKTWLFGYELRRS